MIDCPRSGLSSPSKLTEELKTKVDEQTRDAVAALAYADGMTVSEYIRNVLVAHVYGHGHLLRQRAHPSRARMGPGEGEA